MSLGFLALLLRLRDGQIAKVRFTREFEQLLADPFRLSFCGSSLRRSKTIQLRIGIGLTGVNVHRWPPLSPPHSGLVQQVCSGVLNLSTFRAKHELVKSCSVVRRFQTRRAQEKSSFSADGQKVSSTVGKPVIG
jgi:hypothetical protein